MTELTHEISDENTQKTCNAPPCAGLSRSNNSVSPRSNPQGKGNWLADHKTIKLK